MSTFLDSESKLEDALDEQVLCSLLTGTECELSYTINYGAWYIQAVAQGSHGIIVFMCLGFSKVRQTPSKLHLFEVTSVQQPEQMD